LWKQITAADPTIWDLHVDVYGKGPFSAEISQVADQALSWLTKLLPVCIIVLDMTHTEHRGIYVSDTKATLQAKLVCLLIKLIHVAHSKWDYNSWLICYIPLRETDATFCCYTFSAYGITGPVQSADFSYTIVSLETNLYYVIFYFRAIAIW
jgi:hypothetical protein